MLPGWYGFGTAVSQWLEKKRGALEELREMHRGWPFSARHSRTRHGARQVRPRIASRYAELAPGRCATRCSRASRRVAQTRQQLFAISGASDFLADNPTLARSIRNRFAYLDPLNHIQLALLRRYRPGTRTSARYAPSTSHINGIAAALRNSG